MEISTLEFESLLWAWNWATSPTRLLTDAEHRAEAEEARRIDARLKALGLVEGRDWVEADSGKRYPASYSRAGR